MFRVSVSTLRHYEKIGLLAPEYVDPASGYRYYSTRQFECLNTIRYLRALEMPLDQIRDFLQHREVEKIQEMLLQQRQAVIRKRRALGVVQRKIENRLRQIQDALQGPLEEVRLVDLPARRVAWLRDNLVPRTYLDLEHSIRRLEEPAQEAVAFLGNLLREMFSFLCIPWVAKHLNHYTAIAPAGATSEDTTLSMLVRYTREEIVVLAVINGVLCSAAVPVLIRLFWEILG